MKYLWILNIFLWPALALPGVEAAGSLTTLPGVGHEQQQMAGDISGRRQGTARPTFSGTVGTNTLALDVEGAIRLALENNPELRASDARVQSAAGRARQAKLWSNPELELSVEDWPVSNGSGFSDAKQTIGIAQTLPYPGKKSIDRQVGDAGVKLSAARLTLRRTEIARDVKTVFFRVLAAERLVAESTQLVAVADSSAEAARKRVKAGAAPDQEQLRAELQLEQVRAELLDWERELATARQGFAALLGHPELKDARLMGALAEDPVAALMDADAWSFMRGHPSAAAAQANLERTQLELRRARLEPYPDVKLGVAGGRIGETDQSIIQLGLSLPVPILDRAQGKLEEARANVNEAEAQLDLIQQALQRDWSIAQRRYRTAVEQVRSYRDRILPKANEALRLVRTGFDQGKFNFIDLVDTQRMTAEARLAYQKKLLELNVAQAELEALHRPHSIEISTAK